MNKNPNCPKCGGEKFRIAVIHLDGVADDETDEVIVCSDCGAVIGSRDPFGRQFVVEILNKLGISSPHP
jgi:transcription elongation factor Elf1